MAHAFAVALQIVDGQHRRSLLPPRRAALGILVTLTGILLSVSVLLPFRASLSVDAAALVLVIPVVLGVAIGGFWAAPFGVVTGFLAYDFFFIPPYGTFRVGHPENLVGLAVYAVVGLTVGGVVGQAQRARKEALRRQAETEALSELSQRLAGEIGLEAALHASIQHVRRVFGFDAAAVLLEEEEGFKIAASDGEGLAEPLVRWLTVQGQLREPVLLPQGRGLAVPLASPRGRPGMLVVTGAVMDRDARRLLATFASQATMAVERAGLADEAARVRVLEEVDRLRSALMGAVSHDLRTPLASIKASVSDLANPALVFSDDDRLTLLRTIEEETDRLTRFVSNLLDMSRIEAGALELNRSATPLQEIVSGVLVRMGAVLAGHPIRVDVDEDLPLIDVDFLLIDQVLANLLENAGRYTPPRTPIAVTAAPVLDRWVEVRVRDQGPGIPQEEREKIFELFYSASRGPSGRRTGVGLAICQGIVAAHGGQIWAERTFGGGATFVIRLPVAARGRAPQEPAGERAET